MTEFIFADLDDTVLDFGGAEKNAITMTLKRFGLPFDNETLTLYSTVNKKLWQALERKEITRERVLVQRFELLLEHLGREKTYAEAMNNTYKVFLSREHTFIEGAEELLKRLYGKYRLFIVSNGTTFVQNGRISGAGLEKYFEKIFLSEAIGYDKPDVRFFEKCFAQIDNFDKSKAIIIGDSISSDILGGKNAGIKTCWFNRSGIKESIADYTVTRLEDFDKIL